MSLSNSIKILNPLINPTGYLTTVDQIYDPFTGKTQQEINKESGTNKNIESIVNYYAIASFSTFEGEDIYSELNWILIPNEEGIEAPIVDPINKYLWNYEAVKYNDGEIYKTVPTVIGVYSEGRGIHKVSRWYLINNVSDVAPSVNDANWKEQSEATTDDARYLWRKTETFYTDDLENPEIEIELIGVHGTKGIDGVNVEYVYLLLSETEDDEDGNKIPKRPAAPTAKDNTSSDSLSDASLALGWSDEPHDISKEKPYLWISERKKDTVNNVWKEYMTPTLWAVYGKSIISITTKYTINNDSTTHPSLDETDENGESVWKDYSPAVTAQKPYLWKYTQTILTGGDEREEFEMIGAKGEKGVDGLDIEYIYIRTSEWDGINKPQLPNPLEDKNGNTNTNVDDFIPKGWTDEPEGVSEDIPYQWMRMRKKDTQNNIWGDFTDSKLWAVYGKSILNIEKLYQISSDPEKHPDELDVDNDTNINNWLEVSPAVTDVKPYLWEKTITTMTGGEENITYALIGVKGKPGTDGADIEYIYNKTGTWNGTSEDKPTIPSTGTVPEIDEEGKLTGNRVEGSAEDDDFVPTGWTDEPEDSSKDYPYIWYSMRKKKVGSSVWGDFSVPKLWTKYGNELLNTEKYYTTTDSDSTHPDAYDEDGNINPVWKTNSPATDDINKYLWCLTISHYTQADTVETFELIGVHGTRGIDGSTVDYIYTLTPSSDIRPTGYNNIKAPMNTVEEIQGDYTWYDEPQDVSEEMQCLWISYAEKQPGEDWGSYNEPKLWAKYGADGNGVVNVTITYKKSSSMILNSDITSEENWVENSPELNEIDRFLWKRTVTTYQKALIDDETTGEDETKSKTKISYDMIGTLGEPGIDGAGIEWIYTITKEGREVYTNGPAIVEEDDKRQTPDYIPTPNITTNEGYDYIWKDDLDDITEEYKYAWRSQRKYDKTTKTWGYFSDPIIINKYGEDGNSLLDSVSEYARSSKSDIIPGTVDGDGKDISGWDETTGWQPNSPVVTDEYPYLWKKTIMTYSKPLESEENNTKIIHEMIGVKGNKGVDGTDVEYAYILTKSIETNEDGIIINRPDSPTNEVSTNSRGEWSDDPFDVDEIWKYEWISYRKLVNNEWGPWSEPKLWAKYGTDGVTPIDIYNEYMISGTLTDNPDSTKSVPEEYLIDNEVQWQTSSPATNNTYKYLWKKTTTTYSKDFEINGVLTESRQTVVYDMVGTHGDPGVDGSTVDYIYSLTSTLRPIGYNQITAPLSGNKKVDVVDEQGNEFTETWYDEPQDISEQNQYLWISSAKKESGSDNWSAYSLPTLWAKYGVDGNGIISVEVSYMKSNLSKSDGTIETQNEPIDLPTTPQAHVWYTSSPELDDNYKYLWKRTKTTYNQALTGNLGGNIDYKYEMIGTLGEKGIDGAGSEWAYKLTKTFTKPNSTDDSWPVNSITTNIRGEWTDDPQGFELDDEYLYEWEIKRNKAAGDTEYGPWGVKDGEIYYASLYNTRGKSIKNTTAYYISIPVSDTPSIPSKSDYNTVTEYINALVANDWTTESSFSKLNKYVWEVQIIEYTDGGYDIIGPVFKGNYSDDGEKGDSSYMLYVDTPNIVIPYDPQTLKPTESKNVKINLTLKYGTTTENLSSYNLTATAYKNDGTEPLMKNIEISTDKSYITYNFSNIVVYTNYANYIDLLIKNSDGELVATCRINITYLQFGEVGPSGQAGRMAYPAGNYDNTRKYTRTDKTTPYVYYNDKYYVLDVDEALGQIPSASSESWEEFESFEAIYTKFLMADYANLGSQAGAIVYDNFLFSQMGENKNGESVHYSTYSENNEIFTSNDVEETGDETLLITDDSSTNIPTDDPSNSTDYKPSQLTGNFVPNAFVDFYKGSIACNKFSEHYGKFYLWKNNDPNTGIIQNTYYMDLEKEHNLIIQPRLQTYIKSGSTRYFLARPGVVVLPDYATDNRYNEDGTHVCISYPNPGTPGGYLMSEFIFNGNINGLEYNIKDGSVPGTEGYVLVCADARIFDSENYVSYNDGDNKYYYKYRNPNNFSNSFSWKGYNCKFILMHAGSILKLRSCITGANLDDGFVIPNQRTWMIENAEDFDFAPVDINIYNSKGADEILTFKSCYNGTGFITIGSCNSSYEYNLTGILDTSTDVPQEVEMVDIKAKQLSKSVFSSSSVGTVFESISLSYNLPYMQVYGVNSMNELVRSVTPTFSNINNNDNTTYRMGVEIPEYDKIYTGRYENGMVIGLDISKTADTVNEEQNHISSSNFLDNGAQVTTKIIEWGDVNPSADYKYIVCGHE